MIDVEFQPLDEVGEMNTYGEIGIGIALSFLMSAIIVILGYAMIVWMLVAVLRTDRALARYGLILGTILIVTPLFVYLLDLATAGASERPIYAVALLAYMLPVTLPLIICSLLRLRRRP